MPNKVNKIQAVLMRVSGAIMLLFNLLVGFAEVATVLKIIEDGQKIDTGFDYAASIVVAILSIVTVFGLVLSIYLLRARQKAILGTIILSAVWLIFFIAIFFTSWLKIDCKTLLAQVALMSPSIIVIILLSLAKFRFR